ncbi:MAG: hypothetical protein NVS1B13_20400 [Flavisolibacter sp.]
MLLFAILVLNFICFTAAAQSHKSHLRDFKPVFIIDTFKLNGKPREMKDLVMNIHQVKGVKSAFWDEDSKILTVQYLSREIRLSAIKAFFADKIIAAFQAKQIHNVLLFQ